jgi:hypothetical protein
LTFPKCFSFIPLLWIGTEGCWQLSLFHSISLSVSLWLSLTHTHTHTFSLSLSQSLSFSFDLFSVSHTHSHNTETPSHTHTHARTHTRTHTHIHSFSLFFNPVFTFCNLKSWWKEKDKSKSRWQELDNVNSIKTFAFHKEH